MGLFDGFPFKSREQAEREEREFQKRVLPFGEEGKQKALTVLKECIKAPKMEDTELLWAYFSAKDKYETFKGEDTALQRAYNSINKAIRMKEGDRCIVVALVKLDSEIDSLEEYPTRDLVLTVADELEKML